MRRRNLGSLRNQMAFIGFAAIYGPVLLLLGVGLLTNNEAEIVQQGDERVMEISNGTSGWTVLTVIALGPIAAALAWWWSGRAVMPLDRVRWAADEIGPADLGRRIALDKAPYEVMALAQSFDALLDRVEAASDAQRRLVEEASHELRTPLAVVLTSAEVALAAPAPTVADHAEALTRVRGSARRMRDLVDALLVDARERARALDHAPVDVGAVANVVVAEVAPLGVVPEVVVAGDVAVGADAEGVRRAVAALVENAVRHGAAPVSVAVTGSAAAVVVAVSDHGPGIAPDDQARAFDRFWRGTASAAGGAGLGLAVARHVAVAHGGDLTLTSPGADGVGATFTLTLPRGADPRP